MGFQALFKFVKCWCASDVVRETVPSSCCLNYTRTDGRTDEIAIYM